MSLPPDMARLPDYAAIPGALVVTLGQTLTLPPEAPEVVVVDGGTLTIGPGVTRITTLCVKSGLLVSSAAGEIVIRDRPFNPTQDPDQFNGGILGIGGEVRLIGVLKTAFLRQADDALKGARTVLLAADPVGWAAGDRLVFADTRLVQEADVVYVGSERRKAISQTEYATIQSLSGRTVTLTAPFAFDHKGARKRVGGPLLATPHVGNLTRSRTIRSENATGIRGHLMFTDRTVVTLEGLALQSLGRTKADALHPVTNHIGRYPLHFHHLYGPVTPRLGGQFVARGLAIDDGRKWGLAVHDSHFGVVEDNLVVKCQGSGIVLEEGNETGNAIRRNFVVNTQGSRTLATDIPGIVGDVGTNGTGLWVAGVGLLSTVEDNVFADGNHPVVFAAPDFGTGQTHAPTAPGQDPHDGVPVDPGLTPMTTFNRTEGYSHLNDLFIWGFDPVVPQRIVGVTLWHMAGAAIQFANTSYLIAEDLKIYGDPAVAYDGVRQTSAIIGAGTGKVRLSRLAIAQMDFGVYMVIGQYAQADPADPRGYLTIEDADIEAGVPIYVARNWVFPTATKLKNARLASREGDTSGLLIVREMLSFIDATVEESFRLENVNGESFDLFTPLQAPDAPMPPTTDFDEWWQTPVGPPWFGARIQGPQTGAPERNLTNAQSWAKYSLAYGGALPSCGQTDPRFMWQWQYPLFACPLAGGPTPPPLLVLTCPLAQVVQSDVPIAVTYPPPVVSGGVVPVSVVTVPPSGSVFPLGTTLVTATATDAQNQSAACSFPVTVEATAPPPEEWEIYTPTFRRHRVTGQTQFFNGTLWLDIP